MCFVRLFHFSHKYFSFSFQLYIASIQKYSLLLYLVTSLNSLICSRSFFCIFFKIFYASNHIICKQGQFQIFLCCVCNFHVPSLLPDQVFQCDVEQEWWVDILALVFIRKSLTLAVGFCESESHPVMTLCDPIDYTYTVHGILQARVLEWVAFPFSRGSSQTRDRTQVS